MRGLLSTALVATGAIGAAAIMIPPNVADLGREGSYKIAIPHSKLPVQAFGVDPYTQLVELPCPGCPFAEFGAKGISWKHDQENYLVLNISSNGDRLELNGAQFYPPPMGLTPEPEVLQVPAGLSMKDIHVNQRVASPLRSLRVSSWAMHAGGVHKSGDDAEEVLRMHIQIEALENFPVKIPEITVTAIKTREVGLLIVKSQISDQSPRASQQECHGWPMLCKWRQIVAGHIQTMQAKLRGSCHRHRPGKGSMHKISRPHMQERPHIHERPHMKHKKPHHSQHHKKPHHSQHHKKPHHKKPHHKKPHHQAHHDNVHKVHRVMHNVARVILTIVIPILFGVLAGMLTYLIGMFVGTGIALLWHTIRARRQRYSRIQLEDTDDEEEVLIYAKEGFVEEDADIDTPPFYVEIEGSEVRQQ